MLTNFADILITNISFNRNYTFSQMISKINEANLETNEGRVIRKRWSSIIIEVHRMRNHWTETN